MTRFQMGWWVGMKKSRNNEGYSASDLLWKQRQAAIASTENRLSKKVKNKSFLRDDTTPVRYPSFSAAYASLTHFYFSQDFQSTPRRTRLAM